MTGSKSSSVRNRIGRKKKSVTKDTHYEERKVAEWEARLQAKKEAQARREPTPPTLQAKRKKRVTLDPDDDRWHVAVRRKLKDDGTGRLENLQYILYSESCNIRFRPLLIRGGLA